MRIAQVSTWQTPCGIAGYTEQLTSALNRQGVETEVAAIDRDQTDYLSRGELREYFAALADRVAAADVVHVQHEFSFFSGAYSVPTSLANFRRFLARLRRRGQPAVVTFHTDPYWYARLNKVPIDQALYAAGRLAWRVSMPTLFGGRAGAVAIAQSRTTRRNLINAGISANAIEVVRQGVPAADVASASEEERGRARVWLGLPREARVLGMFGFVSQYKGYDVALKALERLPDHYHLLVVGGRHPKTQQSDVDTVLDAAADPEFAGRVTYTGFVTPQERETCLLATDICLAPYHGFPPVSSSAALTWALASGCPTIASDLPTFRELAEIEDCLELIAPGSATELALAVEMLSADPQRRRELVQGARRYAEEHSWTRVAERHAAIYERVAGARRRTRRRLEPAQAPAPKDPAPALAPAPARMLRRPRFHWMELDGSRHGFWLAHDDDPRDLVAAHARNHGVVETAQWQLIRHLVERSRGEGEAMVVDLGAHVGTFSLALSALGARVLAVEPSPRGAGLVRAAAARNRFERLEVVAAAISDRVGRLQFCDDGPFGRRLAAGPDRSTEPRTIEVPGTTLDQLLEERGWPEVSLVKIDIEGSELAALRGMRSLLSSEAGPPIVLEHNADALAAYGAMFVDVGSELVRHGYRLLAIDEFEPGRLVPMLPADELPARLGDVLAIKPGAEPELPWHITPYTDLDFAGRLAALARNPESVQRFHAARVGANWFKAARAPAVRRAYAQLESDGDVTVRAAALGHPGSTNLEGNGGSTGRADEGAATHLARVAGRRSFTDAGGPTFALATYANGHGGYGYSAEELVLAATAQGADIVWTAVANSDDGGFSPAMRALEAPELVREREVLVIYCGAYDWPSLHAPIALGMTMWETTELPETWIPCCAGNSGLIVPSEFCRQVFGQKIDLPIEVVRLGVNPAKFPELERSERDEFTFLMVGTLSGRKGADIAVEAFEAEFAPHEPVKLLLKTMAGILELGRNRALPDDPRIEVIDSNLSRRELLALYGRADCLVASSRGEASGLTPREAMSTGIPAIVTAWGGLLEIANPECAFVLEVEGEEPAFGPIYPLHATGGARMGRLATPSVEHLRVLMREAYENPDRTREMGRAAARWIRSDWTYEICASRWLEAIATLVTQARESRGAPV